MTPFRILIPALAVLSLAACSKPADNAPRTLAGASAPAAATAPANAASASLDTIRRNLAERLPQLAQLDEIRTTPMPGLYEVRFNGSELMYTDAQGDFLVNGPLLDTKARRNLTEERQGQLSTITFDALPLKDAFVTKRGDGSRKLAVFADPNCPYCKRFEGDLAKVDNITVYTFLLPILSEDSVQKSQHIWCAADRSASWDHWMQKGQVPAAASCDTSALQRNVDFAHKHRITGTPALVFANGHRVNGAVDAPTLEKLLAENK